MTEEQQKQINRLAGYLRDEYEGFVGIPFEMLEDELHVPRKLIPKSLQPMKNCRNRSGKFYSFLDVATALVIDLQDYVRVHVCEVAK